ncbi:hypothetical protein GOP47_0021508 [Adiantum capillus-veneris]|uniref:4-coumarate--CoA ligase n=1 Tax=Adiantum capillus-veneris TaxID=13818 RepID=A0A9D4U7K3_ADICA|nr:hypothetical protein GOP47_0021508 [Adiantum capillus-veneris]
MAPPHQEASDNITIPASLSHPSHKLDSNAAPPPPAPPTYFFRSKLPDIYIPDHLSLTQYCLQRAHLIADKPCLLQGKAGKNYTYGEVEVYARRVSAGLANIGVEKGDTVMLLLPNCAEFVLVFLGAAMRGAMVTTCNPFYTKGEIEKQVTGSGAKLIVTQMACVDKLASIVANRPHLKVMVIERPTSTDTSNAGTASVKRKHVEYGDHVMHMSELMEVDEGGYPEVEINPDDVVALPYSSGTTGLPKGVMLTHRGLVTSIAQQVDGENPNMWFREEDVVLCVLPMFHVYSLSIVLASLRVGAAIAIMGRFEIGALLEVVQRERVSVAPLVPPIVLALAKSPLLASFDLSSIRMLMSGAAPLGKELEDSFRARVPHATIAQGYGMTEAGSVLSMSLSFAKYPFPVKSGSCGTVLRNAIVKIIDPDTGASLPHNKAGEICIKGNQIMKGYINDSLSTSNTIDDEGFLHTGDIGLIDDDEELFIVDRVKEIIKYKGFQVPPAELENILINHPLIADAACVPQKDEAAGEVPIAFVVTLEEASITEEEVKEFVSKQVVFYKKLHKVIFVNQIPKSPSGKILRKELKKRLEEEIKL